MAEIAETPKPEMPSQQPTSEPNPKAFVQVVSTMANLCVIAGIVFAYVQIRQARDSERCRVAMSAIEPTRSTQFLDHFRSLQRAYQEDPDLSNQPDIRESFFYVLNVYDNIAILCLRDLADEELVEASVHRAMRQFEPIVMAMKLSPQSQTNVDAMLLRFQRQIPTK